MRDSARGGLVVALALLLGSCAAMERQQVGDTERFLAEAGFQRKPADTAEKQAHLNGLAPDRLVSFVKDGVRTYAYADPDGCRCLFVGDEAAYQRYRNLVEAPQEAVDAAIAERVDEEGADDAGTDWEYANGPLWW